MSKKLKLADIAQLAGVSKSTVSFVLNGHAEKHRITKDTVERVMQVVKANNYSPSVYARALKSKKTSTYGLVIPDLLNMGFAAIAKELERLCLLSGYQLLIASTEDDPMIEQQAIRNLIDRQVDGIMVASCHNDDGYYQSVAKDLPIVFFDRRFESSHYHFITTNAYDATKALLSKTTQDHDECAYIGGQFELSPSRDRYQGYVDALKENGIELNTDIIFSRNYQPQSGYDMMAQCVQTLGRLPRCLFTASYSLLEGVLRYLNDHNLLGAGDTFSMKIATFDNYSILDCLPLRIDSIEQDCPALAAGVLECLRLCKSNADCPSQMVIPAQIHWRNV
ncbi:LacI family DNA-binding transcriptional regulator [Vibrio parahaemolyticus]|uniref:LacI family DNA-binding transcriptional regulator n=1 Tax=Vibrio mediterranei TaxID=689 RepID=UPI0040678427